MGSWGITEKDNKKYVHVTSALGVVRQKFLEKWRGDIGNVEANRITNEAKDFGKKFHNYTEIIDNGNGHEIDISTIKNELMMNFVMQYRDWFIENVENIIVCEKVFYSEKYLYCGTPDVVYKLKGIDFPVVVDRKAAKSIGFNYEIQLALYKKMLEENGIKTGDRMILHANKKTGYIKPVFLKQENYEEDLRFGLYAKEMYLILKSRGEI